MRQLKRTKARVLGGVCGGIAYWVGMPASIARIVLVCSVLAYGIGIGLYILFWIFVPEWEDDPKDLSRITSS